jgi:long-chain acyl-CoA synthetase
MFCYTSGTTGDPKGAKMSHAGFIGVQHLVDHADDVSISYLPYAHIFEQCAFIFSLIRGFSHGYYSGDPLKLLEDIKVLRPTFMATVPRILNRVHGRIFEMVKTKTPFQQNVFHRAVKVKLENYR